MTRRPSLPEYAHFLRRICEIAALHQKAVIDKLEQLFKGII